ncbi:MAG: pseudouridine-5'-phosphate glycosidase [Gemmatimonadota bacterium]|nr:pseudouridine-5'-phosphate glycosidase [Gemmatimonadota bacterium]
MREALAAGRPVVALETTVLAQGLPPTAARRAARGMDATIRDGGAVPALIGLLRGRAVVGLAPDEALEAFGGREVRKVSRADIGPVLASGEAGATTVAGTLVVARAAGIPVMATGGIGGVHRGWQAVPDISADLTELARTPILVVCSGAKIVLDLPATLEALETLGVPVAGYGVDELPAFYAARSGLALAFRVDSPEEAAGLARAQQEAGLSAGIVVANPPPEASAMPIAELERWIAAALEQASRQGVGGKAVTPFLLDRLAESSGGRTVGTNVDLLIANAGLGGRIAAALASPER